MIDPDTRARLAREFIQSPAWTEWLKPLMDRQHEEGLRALAGDMDEKATAKLRTRLSTLKWLMAAIEQGTNPLVHPAAPSCMT